MFGEALVNDICRWNRVNFICTTVDTELGNCQIKLFNKETVQVLNCAAVLNIAEHRVCIIKRHMFHKLSETIPGVIQTGDCQPTCL